jgi:hypothetical protein
MPTAFRCLARLALALVFVLCGAWGATGHKVVAQIAYDRLTPKARAEVDQLLAGSTLAEFSVWPDQIKGDPTWKWTKPWHFADMPEGATEFRLDRDCPDEGCVVKGIQRYEAVLKSGRFGEEERVRALKFLTHFVGDIHQPLHVGHKADKGGNGIEVQLFSRKTNLHAVWDDGLIKQRGMEFGVYASKLEAALKPEGEKAMLAAMDPVAWATESHALAESHAYKNARGEVIKAGDTLGQDYADRNAPVVDEQLTKAGARLAKMLNAVFDPTGDGVAAPPAAPAVAPPAQEAPPLPAPATKPAVKFVGSKKSEVYHYPGCADAKRILPENLVEYAEAPAGKRLHKGCPR